MPFQHFCQRSGARVWARSLEALSTLDIKGIELGAYGGTNFSRLELLRSNARQSLTPLSHVGHTAEEMVELLNKIEGFKGKEVIISGGIENFLDAHHLLLKLNQSGLYGMAGKVLRELSKGQEHLRTFIRNELSGLNFAKSYLSLKEAKE